MTAKTKRESRTAFCAECGSSFTTISYNKKYCGEYCAKRHDNLAQYEKRKKLLDAAKAVINGQST